LFSTADSSIRRIDPTIVGCDYLATGGGLDISPDGGFVFTQGISDNGPLIERVEVRTGDRKLLLSKCVSASASPSISNDGLKLAFIGSCSETAQESHLFTVVVASPIAKDLGVLGAADADPSWSPLGDHIAISSDSGGKIPSIVIVDVATMKRRTIASGYRPSWSPNGDWIAYLSSDSSAIDRISLHAIRPDGSGDHELWSADSLGSGSNVQIINRATWGAEGHVIFGIGSEIWEIDPPGKPQMILKM